MNRTSLSTSRNDALTTVQRVRRVSAGAAVVVLAVAGCSHAVPTTSLQGDFARSAQAVEVSRDLAERTHPALSTERSGVSPQAPKKKLPSPRPTETMSAPRTPLPKPPRTGTPKPSPSPSSVRCSWPSVLRRSPSR